MMILILNDFGAVLAAWLPYRSKKVIYIRVIGWVRPARKGRAMGPVDSDYRAYVSHRLRKAGDLLSSSEGAGENVKYAG
ncbi:MAG TPA: hypothetical protein PLN19_08290 [Methanothrix sp.]|jgi:hypothetical protein|nr:hypothetical protein [Methanothrix sp.]HPC89648.1 hypothetical protein [Methanothrix sp.]HQE88254.1 hypothetical protein [Methanothrix sp.]HQI67977.1 hypothetical protein [Methanothrix sp.]HRS84937.1 hypothetical protein [Methanothrix sp.]